MSSDSHPNALKILKTYPQYISWQLLTLNANEDVMNFLEQHRERISLALLSHNPNIFESIQDTAAKKRRISTVSKDS